MSIEGKCEKCGGETTDYRCLTCTEEERDKLLLQIDELRTALEIAKPSTIHVYSGHIYEDDGRLVEFVDGCARCRIERVLKQTEKR